MSKRGRKRKKEVSLHSEKHTPCYIDYADESVKTQTMIWEYKNTRENTTEVCKIPLSKQAAIQYWESKISENHDSGASSMLSRIYKESYKSDFQRHFYDMYPSRIKLIDQLLYASSCLCTIKNYSKRSGDFYPYAMGSILRYIDKIFPDIKELNEFNPHIQNALYNELSKTNSKFFTKSVKAITKKLVSYGLDILGIDHTLLNRLIKNHTHTGKDTRLDYPQEIALQLLAAAVSEINTIKANHNEYLKWKEKYKNKSFDSIENLAKAYISIPSIFMNMEPKPRIGAIYSYQQSYNRICSNLYGVNLNNLSKKELNKLSRSGINIDNLADPYIMAWFIDDVLENFPFPKNIDIAHISHKTNMENFSRWKIKAPITLYLKNKGSFRNIDLVSLFNDILSRKYPTGEKIIPFITFWMIQTGSNPEAVVNMKKDIHNQNTDLLNDTCIVRSYKNKGTKDYYWFALDQSEENGLYDIYQFAKSYLSYIWKEKDSNTFWSYYSISRHSKITNLTSSRLNYLMSDFMLKHKILLPDGSPMENIQPSRLRNTFITMADLHGASIDDIKEWIRHGNMDTRFLYYGNSPEQRSRNFRAIHGIQESIIEDARNFKGQVNTGSYKEYIAEDRVVSTYLCGCEDHKKPAYFGANDIAKGHICVDWDMCLLCPRSHIFKENLPRICARILQYENQQVKMTSEEWGKNFYEKYTAAKDALRSWIEHGGSEEEIDEAWALAKSGKVKLPPFFPVGQIKIIKGKDIHVA